MTGQASPLHEGAERIGDLRALDGPAREIGEAVRSKLGRGPLRDALSGEWLGHSLHPLLTDTVIGTWTSALLLDLLPGGQSDRASQRLIAAGVLAYLPTAASGAQDWADAEVADDAVRRIGVVHAATNTTALAFQIASFVQRRRGNRIKGVALSMASAAALGVAGHLGGHLSYVKGVGVDRRP